MPGNLLAADTGFPDLNGQGSAEEKLKAVSGYLYMLLEQLRYTLANLGQDNFNDTELDNLGKLITGPLTIRVEETEKGVTQLTVTVDGVKSTVRSLDGRFSTVEQNVNGLNIQTVGGTTCITGDHVKTGRLVSQNGASEIDLNTGEANLSGSYKITDPATRTPVGGIKYDTHGLGSATEAQNRMYLYTDGGYAIKIEASGDLSLQGTRVVYLKSGVNIVFSAGGTKWHFSSDGLYCNDVLAVPKPKGA